MLLGIGTDIVAVERLARWEQLPEYYLKRVFTEQEISDSVSDSSFDCKSFAARFAAKEAFFKALCSALLKLRMTKQEFSFLFICRHVQVVKGTWDVPQMIVDWRAIENKIEERLPVLNVDVSFAHEQDYAVAFVVIYR